MHERSHRRIFSADTALRILKRIRPFTATLEAPAAPRTAAALWRNCTLALAYGAVCHVLFAGAVLAMMVGMWFGMSGAFGTLPGGWAWLANVALLLQFPILHSLLLARPGRRLLARLAPDGHGMTLGTTTFAILASIQLLALFALWTPSGIVWWRAEGLALWIIALMYAASWLLLIKASWDAGAEVQSGLLGWLSLLRGVKPVYPPMPQTGLFRIIRQPIYVSFALTTWTVPTWTPDQVLVAVTLTVYCLAGPLLKERRFDGLYGQRWRDYRARTPYCLPAARQRNR